MTTPVEPDPFDGIEDDPEIQHIDIRQAFLAKALRGYVPIRKTFVQRPRGSGKQEDRPVARASVLYDFVNGRHVRPLHLYLLIHALEPMLEDSPLKLAVWANLLSVGEPCPTSGVTKALRKLEEMNLIKVSGSSHQPTIDLLREDGSGEPWIHPGLDGGVGPGYFALPHSFWTQGWSETLSMPGIAMLLIMLAETQDPKKPAFQMAYERAPEWYGISERTAERGYRELDGTGLLNIKVTKVRDINHPAGRREVYWRALKGPFSTWMRERLQDEAKKAAREKAAREKALAGAEAAATDGHGERG